MLNTVKKQVLVDNTLMCGKTNRLSVSKKDYVKNLTGKRKQDHGFMVTSVEKDRVHGFAITSRNPPDRILGNFLRLEFPDGINSYVVWYSISLQDFKDLIVENQHQNSKISNLTKLNILERLKEKELDKVEVFYYDYKIMDLCLKSKINDKKQIIENYVKELNLVDSHVEIEFINESGSLIKLKDPQVYQEIDLANFINLELTSGLLEVNSLVLDVFMGLYKYTNNEFVEDVLKDELSELPKDHPKYYFDTLVIVKKDVKKELINVSNLSIFSDLEEIESDCNLESE